MEPRVYTSDRILSVIKCCNLHQTVISSWPSTYLEGIKLVPIFVIAYSQYERRYSSTWFRNQSHWSKLMVERTSQQSTIILEIYWNIYWEYLEITELRVPTFNIILLMIERNNLFLMVTSYLPYTYLGGVKWVSVLNTPHNQDLIRQPMEGLQKQRHRYKLAE